MATIWTIDDAPSVHEMVEETLAHLAGSVLRLESFFDAETAVFELDARIATGRVLPDIILMDFFLGTAYGSDVTVEVKRRFPGRTGPIIAGHSSMPDASRAIVDLGGDFVLEKPRGPFSKPLMDALGSAEAVEFLLLHRKPIG